MAINNILESTLNSYPVFRPNQVLTDGQLNNIVQYLDGQNRLTRVLLLGTGIACGFEPVWVEASKALQISAGFGVTSDGYLIHEPAQSLNLYRRREVPTAWFGFKNIDGLPNSFIAEELSSGIANVPDSIFPIDSKSFLINKVLIYVLELNNQDNLGLCNNDCDGRSDSLQFNLHKLLFSEKDALTILAKTYEVDTAGGADVLQHTFYEKYFMTQLSMPRFGYESDGIGQNFSVRLDNINSYDIFRNKYATILEKYVDELSTALQQAHLIFSPVLTPGETTTTVVALPAALVTKINNRTYDPFEVQYLYDHLADLTDAYEEFVEAAFDLIADCNITPKCFPNHLMVRKFNAVGDTETEPYSVYRTPYTLPPIYNGNNSRLNEVRTLFQRLIALAGSYPTPSILGKDEIKVTPSKSYRAPLSERAVPYYYPSSLADVWSPHQNRFNRKGKVYSYHRPTEAPYSDPLVFEMQGSDFLRIEGHIGQDFMDVMGKLSNIQQKYNLPFSTIALKIDTEFDDELFQFECENFECELQGHREKYIQIREEFQTNVIEKLSVEGKIELGKTEFNKIISTNLDTFSYVEFEKIYTQYERRELDVVGNKLAIGFLPPQQKLPFKQVNECFLDIQNRITEIKNRHLFHHFSKVYPGMDHKAGVPFGGTFILAYVEPTEIQSKINEIITANPNDRTLAASIAQRRIVVADFYLPYNCCSNCPPICYVVARPKPIFSVTPSVFCIGDTEETMLQVTAHPGGGQISGPGYQFKGGKHLFVPAKAGTPDVNGQIKLNYYVDGAEAVALITLVPLPAADFVMQFNDEVLRSNQICEGQGPVELVASGADGEFSIIIDGDETSLNGSTTYDPSAIQVPTGEERKVTIRYRAKGNYCDRVIDQLLTILPKPDATFSFDGNKPTICREDDQIRLLPKESGGRFTATVDGALVEGIIVRNLGDFYFKPSALNPAVFKLNPEGVTVHVKYEFEPEQGCPNSSTQTIQVVARPLATFIIEDQNRQVCKEAGFVNLRIDPPVSARATATFTAGYDGVDPIILTNNQFDPTFVTTPAANGTRVTIRLTVTDDPCKPTFTEQTILVLPAPEIDFEANFINEPGANFNLVRVTNIKPVLNGRFKWTSEPKSIEDIPNHTNPFGLRYDQATQLPINLTLEVEREGCTTKLTKSLLPDVQRFELSIPNPDGGIPTELISDLRDGEEIFISRFRNAEFFNIQALTIPNIVRRVRMTLTGDLDKSTDASTPGNYRLDDLLVQVGNYTIEAIPFAQNDQEGTARKRSFRIVDELQMVEPTEDTINSLRKRDNTYRTAVKDLGKNEALAQTPAFQMANGFVSFQGPPEEFNARYNSTSVALIQAAGQATAGSVEHKQILSLMSIATRYFMDKQVFQASDQLSEETIKTLKDQLADMKKAGVKMASLKTSWNGNALKKQLSAPSVDAIQELLK
jgi:hypothetical protein